MSVAKATLLATGIAVAVVVVCAALYGSVKLAGALDRPSTSASSVQPQGGVDPGAVEPETYSAAEPAVSATYDTDAYCRKIGDAVGGSYVIEQTCRQQELAARAQIAAMAIPLHVQRYCEQIGAAVGGSYTIMETCVEQELHAKAGLSY